MSDVNKVDIRVYQSTDIESVRDLFLRAWGYQRSLSYDTKFWNKTILDTCPAIVATRGRKAVGYYMILPVSMSDGRSGLLGGQAIDSMIDPAFQGKGLFKTIASECYSYCADLGIHVLFGAPNKAAYRGNVGPLNWCHISEVIEYARPLSSIIRGAISGQKTTGATVMEEIKFGSKLVKFSKQRPKEVGSFLSGFGKKERRWSVDTNTEWFDFRYRDVDEVGYNWISVYDEGEIVAFAVCGVSAGDARLRKATLGELVFAKPEAGHLAIRAVLKLASRAGADYVVAKNTSRELSTTFYWHGFLRARKTPLITRVLTPRCHAANPFVRESWALFGGAFDTM